MKSYEEDIDLDENGDFQSKDPFTRDPFELTTAATTSNDGSDFNSIIGNNNISNNSLVYAGYHTNGAYDQSNDFLMNFYASQCNNYSPFTANTCNNTNIHQPHNSSYSNDLNSCSSSYNPFHQHFCVLTSPANAPSTNISRHNDDINSNNDNWANFDSSLDNFADFDSHFTSMTPATFSNLDSANSTFEESPPATTSDSFTNDDDADDLPCFVATTQVLEISSVPPQQSLSSSSIKFQLGPNTTSTNTTSSPAAPITANIKSFDELDDEEFFSLRDDSNDMSSLTDDFDKKFTFENTEVPEDDDDDFASADER